MNATEPSQTALLAAAARAAHLIVDDKPLIFSDPLAYALLGDRAEEFLQYHRLHGTHVVLAEARSAVITRSRFTEERLVEAVDRGVDQYVILGAGLDSYAFRQPARGRNGLRVFEVDHPATQLWKRDRLREIAESPFSDLQDDSPLTFVPVDLETEPLTPHLLANGFDPARPAFVSWLGVTMYLTREAIDAALAAIGALAPGTEIVVDYLLPAELRDEAGQTYVDNVAPISAERGEPWVTFLSPEEMAELLHEHGFEVIRQVTRRESVEPEYWDRTDALQPSSLGMLAHAGVRRPIVEP
ncbi:MAG TPA: class I SAM-dependent methyltransferase [Actinocrinis sp.]|nr:class I SAM-dependent methyltransferase [Actinocrinis sp.]